MKSTTKYNNLRLKEIKTLDTFIQRFILLSKYYVKSPIYNYHKLNDIGKHKIVGFCLHNNILEFKKSP